MPRPTFDLLKAEGPLPLARPSRGPVGVTPAASIELLRRIGNGQFNLRRLCLKDRRAPAAWNAALSA
jgi:hypothetical protein